MPEAPPNTFAYLGPSGTFTEAALRQLPVAMEALTVPMRSVPEALDAVRRSEADAALVPLENSVEGSVPVTLDTLASGDPLVITAEVVLPVTFVLAARIPMEEIATVTSHPHALAQCRGFLAEKLPNATPVESMSTAAAAQAVSEGRADACVCAPLAAEQHHLTARAFNIADNPDAETRFVLVNRPGDAPPAPTGHDITSLVAYIEHNRVGALLDVLTELALRGVNLTRIESRPTGERLGRYAFFLDCTGHIAGPAMGEALMGLRRVCDDVRYLGSYVRDTKEPSVSPPEGLGDRDFDEAAQWLTRLRTTGGA